jgi:ABC-type glutathione transport system ATPase component
MDESPARSEMHFREGAAQHRPATPCHDRECVAMSALFELRNVCLRGDPSPRLDHVSLTIPAGSTAIVGYSGAGKTSLLNLLAGFEHPDAGQLEFRHSNGVDASGGMSPRLPIYWCPQNGGLWPHITVRGHLQALTDLKNVRPSANSADEILRRLDLAHRSHAFPGELSLGERARLALARALVSGAGVLLLDEPLAHVDLAREKNYWQLIREIVAENRTALVFTSHEPEVVVRESTHVICLDKGRLIFEGVTSTLYDDPPDPVSGAFLGRLNWIDEQVVPWWLSATETACHPDRSQGVRPHRIEIQPDAASRLIVTSTSFEGAFSETTLQQSETGQQQSLLHLSGHPVKAGDRVRVILRPLRNRV